MPMCSAPTGSRTPGLPPRRHNVRIQLLDGYSATARMVNKQTDDTEALLEGQDSLIRAAPTTRGEGRRSSKITCSGCSEQGPAR